MQSTRVVGGLRVCVCVRVWEGLRRASGFGVVSESLVQRRARLHVGSVDSCLSTGSRLCAQKTRAGIEPAWKTRAGIEPAWKT
eukprot:107252-Chlamydomonas_euryale.AAC.1